MKLILKISFYISFFIIFFNQLTLITCHGRLMEPVARGSRWRFNTSAPADYNDNEGFCGGFFKQWEIHNGKCGLCGNDYDDEIPRAHELGGVYGEGVIVKTYKSGTIIDVGVYITAHHKGYFIYHLCNINENKLESEECFTRLQLKLANGKDKYYLERETPGWYNATIQLPNKFACNHCVLRWTYNTGNSWGVCSDGSQGLGCGAQENFKGCSDISIKN